MDTAAGTGGTPSRPPPQSQPLAPMPGHHPSSTTKSLGTTHAELQSSVTTGARNFCMAEVGAVVVTIPPRGQLTGPRPTGPPIGQPTDPLTGPLTDHPTPLPGDLGGGGVRTAQN